MIFAVGALYKNKELFHSRLKVLKHRTTGLTKVPFNDLQAMGMRKNGHNKDLDGITLIIPSFFGKTNYQCHKIYIIINNHHLATYILTTVFAP